VIVLVSGPTVRTLLRYPNGGSNGIVAQPPGIQGMSSNLP
jgi:hypothetical protein